MPDEISLEKQIQIANGNAQEFAAAADFQMDRADEAERLLAACRRDLAAAERRTLNTRRERNGALHKLRMVQEVINA